MGVLSRGNRNREYMKIPIGWIDVLDGCSDDDAGWLIKSIMTYAICGAEPEAMEQGKSEIWEMAKKDIDYQRDHPRAYRYREESNQTDRFTIEYTLWRNAVYERDCYTCQHCGQIGGRLNAHHIKPYAAYPELRTSIENGITLCESCHRAVHRGEIRCPTGF